MEMMSDTRCLNISRLGAKTTSGRHSALPGSRLVEEAGFISSEQAILQFIPG